MWVTRGPIETIFVKKNFKIRVKLRQNFFALACLGEKVKLCCRQARAKFFDANFENCFNKNCFYGSSGDPHQTSSLRLLCTKIGDFFSLRFEDLMVSFRFFWCSTKFRFFSFHAYREKKLETGLRWAELYFPSQKITKHTYICHVHLRQNCTFVEY